MKKCSSLTVLTKIFSRLFVRWKNHQVSPTEWENCKSWLLDGLFAVTWTKRWGRSWPRAGAFLSARDTHTLFTALHTRVESQPELQKCAWFLDYLVCWTLPHIPAQTHSLPGLQQPEFYIKPNQHQKHLPRLPAKPEHSPQAFHGTTLPWDEIFPPVSSSHRLQLKKHKPPVLPTKLQPQQPIFLSPHMTKLKRNK